MRGRLQVWHIFRGMELLSKNIGHGHYLGSFPLPCFSFPASLRKELIYLSGAIIFLITIQGTLSDHLAVVPNGFMHVVPQDCIYLHTFKSCYLRTWLLVSLNLDAKTLSFGTLIDVGTSSNTGSY